MMCVCVLMLSAADGSLWTPVVRPVSVPVVSRRTPSMTSPPPAASMSSDVRQPPPPAAAAAVNQRHQLLAPPGFESRRRATSAYSLPSAARTGTAAVNGPSAFVEPRRPASRSDRLLRLTLDSDLSCHIQSC